MIQIKYYLGTFTINHPVDLLKWDNLTAQQVEQVLVHPEFKKAVKHAFGDYDYYLDGDNFKGYVIKTTCGFTETGYHKTPKKAYRQFVGKMLSWGDRLLEADNYKTTYSSRAKRAK